MIIRSKDKINVNGKNIPVWVLDTDALTVTHSKAQGLENMFRLCAREPIYAAMVYV